MVNSRFNLKGLENVKVSDLSSKVFEDKKGFDLTLGFYFGTLDAQITVTMDEGKCNGVLNSISRTATQLLLCKGGNLVIGSTEKPITVTTTVYIPFKCVGSDKISITSIEVKTGDIIHSTCYPILTAIANTTGLSGTILTYVNESIKSTLSAYLKETVTKMYEQIFPEELCLKKVSV